MIWLGALYGIMAVMLLFVVFCLVQSWLVGRPPRPIPQRSEPDSTYALADDIDVPLIEVVLEAEARADPNYWTPKTWADVGRWVAEADTLRPSPQLPDPHYRLHELLNSPPTTAAPRPTRPSPARELGGW